MPEAQLEDFGSGLAPVTQGWFVVNVRDAEWWSSASRGARCAFESEYGDPPVEFAQFGINVTVLEPGQTVLYHAESNQEAFLVLSGECALLVEDEERRLMAWDFFHSSPWTEHAFVGAGEGPCVILMVGSRSGPGVHYPASQLAARYGASVAEDTSDWRQAYATVERFRRERPPNWARLPWAAMRSTAVTIDDSQRPALDGGDPMNDKPKWQVARLDDIERRGRDIPVREHLGIHAFGINAYTPGEDGTLISEHDESGSGQEELYIVLDGKATFEVDGEAFDAPAGTFVSVRPESRRKATGDGTVLALGATPGEAYQGVDWGEAWPFHRDSMTAYGEERYADALEAVSAALEHMPDHAGLNYNYACFATLAGETGDETFAHLRRSVELLPRFREDARRDDDFAAVRDDPRFEEALR